MLATYLRRQSPLLLTPTGLLPLDCFESAFRCSISPRPDKSRKARLPGFFGCSRSARRVLLYMGNHQCHLEHRRNHLLRGDFMLGRQ